MSRPLGCADRFIRDTFGNLTLEEQGLFLYFCFRTMRYCAMWEMKIRRIYRIVEFLPPRIRSHLGYLIMYLALRRIEAWFRG